MDITKLNERLELDAYKYADQFPSADERIKRILKNAYLSGEHKVADKVINYCMNDKDNNKETNIDFEQIEIDVAKELFVKIYNTIADGEECAQNSIIGAHSFVSELKKYIGQNGK